MKIINLYSKEEKKQGLMGVKKLPVGTLVVFHDIESRFFHTMNCLFPLDIVALDLSGIILAIHESPTSISNIPIPQGTSKVIETHMGWFNKNGYKVGQKFFL